MDVEHFEKTPPWLKSDKPKKPPPPTDNKALEDFISVVESTLMNTRNTKKASDNLNVNERKAMRTIRNWDDCIVRLQDK